MVSAVISPVFGSTSAKITGAPHILAAFAVAKKVTGLVNKPSFGPRPSELYNKCKAAVPELHTFVYLQPK